MLLDQIQEDLKTAQLQKDEVKVSTLRMLISAVRYTSSGRESEFSDEVVATVIQKELKKRVEASVAFRRGNREELALKEEREAEVLKTYLPPQISDEKLSQIVDLVIAETGASSIAEMGKVIASVLEKVRGQTDGGRVSQMVKGKLNG